MPALSLTVIAMFVGSIALQLLMISMLPLSKGYTQLVPTVIAVVSVNIAMWLLARLTSSGAQLSILVPLSGTVIPLGSIGLGILVYGEPAPVLKVVLLLVAAGIIGLASAVR